jgi:hypothetical protein
LLDPNSPSDGGQNRGLWAIPLASCLLGIAWVYWPQWSTGFQSMPDLLRDPRLVNYTLEHGFRWVMQYPLHAEFWQTPLYYPQPNVTAYTDVLIGTGPLYWMWRWLGAEPDTALQLWMVGCSSLNFVAAFQLLSRGLRVSVPAAALGAFLMAFGGPATIRIWHPQLIPQFFVYVGLLAIFEIFSGDSQRRKSHSRRIWIGVLAVMAVLQFYTAFYPFFFFSLVAAFALGVSLVGSASRKRIGEFFRWHGAFTGGWLAGSVVCLMPLLWQYLATAEELGLRPFMTRFAPRPASWFLLGTENLWFGWLQRPGGPLAALSDIEHAGGVGFLTAAVGAVGLWRGRQRRGVSILIAATGVLMVLATLFGDFSIWRWVHHYLPGAGAIRVLSRSSMVFALVMTLGVALCCDVLARHGRYTLAAVLALLCITEQFRFPYPQIEKRELRSHIEGLAAQIDDDCAVFAAVYTGPPGYLLEDDDAAWIQLATGKPTINGRYGNSPKNWKLYRHQSDAHRPDPVRLRREAENWLLSFGANPDELCWVTYPFAYPFTYPLTNP